MIDIEQIKSYCTQGLLFMSEHASARCIQRQITQQDIRSCIMTGEIIEQYPDDFPFPSCLIYGHTVKGDVLHIVASDNGEASKIITAYYPNTVKFEADLKTRRRTES